MEPQYRSVLILSDVLGGGTGNHLFGLAGKWCGSGWEPVFVSQCARHDGAVAPFGRTEILPPKAWYYRYPISQMRVFSQVAARVRKYRPDVLHSYFFWSVIYGRLLKAMGKVRVLVENRESEGTDWGRQEYAFLKLTRSLPDRVICVSEAVKDVVVRKEGIHPDKAMVIRNGVVLPQGNNVERMGLKRAMGLPDDCLVVGMVANMNRPVKGVRYFVEAIPSVLRAVQEAHFVVVGHGPERRALEERAEALGVGKHVTFTGHQKDVAPYYRLMDLSVLTSLSEGLSITLLESMSYGLPVVVTRVGGNPELVRDGETGFLVEPRDVQGFVRRVIEVLSDARLRARMGAAARDRIEKEFVIDRVARRYVQVYNELYETAAT